MINQSDGLDFNPDIAIILDAFNTLVINTRGKFIPIKSLRLYELEFFYNLYIRVRTGNCALLNFPVLVIASVGVTEMAQGCFSALLLQLKKLAIKERYMLKIENVLTPYFRDFLTREGFIFPFDEMLSGSCYWLPEGCASIEELSQLPV